MKNSALYMASVIFAIVALAHLLRIVMGWVLVVGGIDFPQWISGLAFIILAALCLWMIKAAREP